MGMLDNIQTGRENKPPRIMIYGSEGIGKSSYAAGAPNAIFIQTEDGLGEIDCRKFPLAHSLSEVIAELTALRDEAHKFQTVVVDSVDWLERLIFDEVCREFGVRSIEKAAFWSPMRRSNGSKIRKTPPTIATPRVFTSTLRA